MYTTDRQVRNYLVKELSQLGQQGTNVVIVCVLQGYNCWEKLETVCMYTTDRQVRNYLVKELSQLGQLSREEQEMVTYVQRLETLYSCTSFEQAVSFRMETTPGLG